MQKLCNIWKQKKIPFHYIKLTHEFSDKTVNRKVERRKQNQLLGPEQPLRINP